MSDLISIIIPVYNAGKTIDGCVESVLKSTYSDFEILIIDDGSNVETAEECDKVALKDHRIKVIHQENGGVSKARNCGIENAKGKFITFVDADDTVDSDLLASMMNAMRQEQADVVITGHRECYDDGSFKECFCSEKESIKCGTEILSEFFTTNNISWTVWAKLYTRSIIGDVRFQVGKRIAEDMYFNYEILKKAKTVRLKMPPILDVDISSFHQASCSGMIHRLSQYSSKAFDYMIYHTSSQKQYYKDQFSWLSSKSEFVLLGVDYEYWKNKIYPGTKEKNSYIVCVGYRKRDWKSTICPMDMEVAWC